jgi:Zn-dependent metalloprotease
MHCRSHALHCVLPPIVLENIARKGDEEQREWATRALSQDHSIRLARVQNSLAGVATSSQRADALVGVAAPRPARVISDAQGTEDVRGPIVRREGDPPTNDTATDEAYDGLGDTFDFWLRAYGRNSIDDAGMPLRGVVHFGDRYPNGGFWRSLQQQL